MNTNDSKEDSKMKDEKKGDDSLGNEGEEAAEDGLRLLETSKYDLYTGEAIELTYGWG